jgi:hypothetical protein
MAGDETKRSEASKEPEAGSGGRETSVPEGEPSDPLPEPTAEGPPPAEPGSSFPEAEAPSDIEEDVAPEDGRPERIETSADPIADPISGNAASSVEPEADRARVPLLARLVPYLVVFAIGALVSIGAAFILNLLAGPPPENRGEIDRQIAALDARAAVLERKQEMEASRLGALTDRFASTETNAKQVVAAVREIEKSVAALPAATASTKEAAHTKPVDLGPLTERLAALEQQLEQGKAAASAASPAAEAPHPANTIARHQAIAIVAGRLVQEVERGEPYHHELNALLTLGVDESTLAPLQSSADSGVASLRHLADEFTKLTPAIFATERHGGEDNVVERLKGYASRLVQIERAGDLDSKDLHGLVARIKFALAHDHVGEAYALWTELPPEAKASSERFGTSAKERLDALEAARSIESGAVGALSKPKS